MKNKTTDATVDGNALLYTGTYYCMLKLLGEDTAFDRVKLKQIIKRWEVSPGLLVRAHSNIPQSHDDYIGILAAAFVYGLPFAERVLDYGDKSDWWFSSKYFGRLPGFAAHVRVCANKPLTPYEQLAWCADIIPTTLKKGDATSGRIMDLLKALAMRDKSYLLTGAALWWMRYRLKSVYKTQPLGQIFSIYFHPGHPFSVFGDKAFENQL